MPTQEALEFLADSKLGPAPAVIVVFGDEGFLKQLALAEARRRAVGDDADDGDLARVTFSGEDAELREVVDELSTRALFGGGRRFVVVRDAEEFVTKYRSELEDYVARPKSSGVLVLEVGTWPATTRLFKAVAAAGWQIDCRTPKPDKVVKWLVAWAKQRHAAKLSRDAAERMLDLVGPEFGLLDQELAKLSVSTPPGAEITPALVDELVGGWRAKSVWELLDSAAAGDAPAALEQLDRMLMAGENPLAIFGPASSALRRFAAATRIFQEAEAAGRKLTLRQALEQAGVKPFVLAKSEEALKQLSRQRAGKLYRWLLAADLDLKGDSRLPPRMVLERLVARLARTAPNQKPPQRMIGTHG